MARLWLIPNLFQLYLCNQRRFWRDHAGIGLCALGGHDRTNERRVIPGDRHITLDIDARQALTSADY